MKDISIHMNFKYSFFFQFASPLFYLTIFYFISNYLSEISNNQNINYFLFVSIGICMIDVLTNIVSSQAREIITLKTSGMIDEILFLDTNINSTLVAISGYSIFISIIKFIIYIFLISIFNGGFIIPLENITLFILTFLSLLISFIGMATIAGVYALAFHKAGIIPLVFIFLSVVFGSAYFPSYILPLYLQKISYLTSFSFGMDNLRLLLNHNIHIPEVLINIIFIISLSILYYSIGLALTKIFIKKIKKSGALNKF